MFKQGKESKIRAEKVSGTGALYYVYWFDDNGDKYVQIVDNVGGGGTGTGTFSSDLFRADSLISNATPVGYDPISGARRETYDNNMRAFLRAIHQDILLRIKKPRNL